MAGGSLLIGIPLLLSCVFQASDHRIVQQVVYSSDESLSVEDHIIPKIPITFPKGTDLSNINVTSVTIKACTGMKEQLMLLSRQLQRTTVHNSQLSREATGLRNEARLLNLQLATCRSTASAITGSYQTQLHNKMTQLLETFDSDAFLILKVLALTREVTTLKKKIKQSANSNGTTTGIGVLQRELREKTDELTVKTQQIERSHSNSSLILQIISLQNVIWDLEQTESTGGETLQPNGRILALQDQLKRKISELRVHGDSPSAMLELIFVRSRVAVLQRLISVHIKESRVNATEYQRSWRQKVELLKRKILQLNREENNAELTKEILILQSEVEHLSQLMSNIKKTTDSRLTELKGTLEQERKVQVNLQKQLEEVEYVQAQLIMKVINMLEELRELQTDEQDQTTSTSQAITLQRLLQAKEMEYVKAQAEINELQGKLRLKSKEYSGLEERFKQLKTEYEQKIVELNSTRDSKMALVLNVINLHDDLKTLRNLISTTEDPERVSELQRELEEKQDELNSNTENIERLTMTANPRIILTIIELQNEIWELQKKAANQSTSGRVKELQNRVDGLISELDQNESTKMVLKILTLQSRVEQLQRQLSDLHMLQTTQVTKLQNDLTAKKRELQTCVNELHEKNQTNARLILTATDLHNQLRNLEKKKLHEDQTASATITKLREQLKAKEEEHSRDQAEINALQNKVNQTDAHCSSFEENLKGLQNDLDSKMKELQSSADTITSLALQVSTLTLQVEELKKQLKNSGSETKIKELQQIIDEKTNELAKKTEELEGRSAQPHRFLQIIAIQTKIERITNMAVNDTDYAKIRALQDHLNSLIDGIQDENNENAKLMFKILTQQDEIARLKKQKESQTQAGLQRITDLENELENVRNQIKYKKEALGSSNTRIANLSTQIMELQKKIKPLEDEISYLKEDQAEKLEELQKRLDLTKRQMQDSELRLKEADAKNFDSIMEIATLRAQLKKAQKQASKAAEKDVNVLELQIQTQERENRKLENTNKDLQQEVEELRICCSDVNSRFDDLQKQLQQSLDDTDHLQQQLHEKEAKLKQLQQKLEEKTRENNKLQDNCNNLQKNLTHVEDKTIYATKVTLDPNTAHPRISLSADLAEMSTSEEIQNVPDHPGRFDVALAALGTVGFSSGRHYWEVSVAGKRCYLLGMASESAHRKGAIVFLPTNGFWTIILDKQGQYKAANRRTVVIPVKTQPLTLGILLDYKKGRISFYDPGTRSHIYSFLNQRFTDKIYPFIQFCVEDVENLSPIVLLAPGPVDWIK